MAGTMQPDRFVHLTLKFGVLVLALILGVSVLHILRTRSSEPVEYTKAQLGCYCLARASEKYAKYEANEKHELPNTLRDLVEPPFGGGSFLENEGHDLIDPWGQPYQMERAKRSDGSEYILVKTTAPDGTPISQYGVGPNSVPRH